MIAQHAVNMKEFWVSVENHSSPEANFLKRTGNHFRQEKQQFVIPEKAGIRKMLILTENIYL